MTYFQHLCQAHIKSQLTVLLDEGGEDLFHLASQILKLSYITRKINNLTLNFERPRPHTFGFERVFSNARSCLVSNVFTPRFECIHALFRTRLIVSVNACKMRRMHVQNAKQLYLVSDPYCSMRLYGLRQTRREHFQNYSSCESIQSQAQNETYMHSKQNLKRVYTSF